MARRLCATLRAHCRVMTPGQAGSGDTFCWAREVLVEICASVLFKDVT